MPTIAHKTENVKNVEGEKRFGLYTSFERTNVPLKKKCYMKEQTSKAI